jgi:hypothetical protein
VKGKLGARDVRFGSKADIAPGQVNVRFTPKSGHWNSLAKIADIARCAAENKRLRHNYASVHCKSSFGFCVGGAFADIAPECERDEASG